MNVPALFVIVSALSIGIASAELNPAIGADATCLMTIPANVQFESYCTNEGVVNIWDFGDGDTSDEQNPMHTYNVMGSFTIAHSCSKDGEVVEDETYLTITGEGECPTSDCPVDSGWCQVSQSTEVEYDTENPVMYFSNSAYRNTTDNSERDSEGNLVTKKRTVGNVQSSVSGEIEYGEEGMSYESVSAEPESANAEPVAAESGGSMNYLIVGGVVILMIGAAAISGGHK